MKGHKTVNIARSKKNGIVFYSNECPFIASETFLDDMGKIQSRLIPSILDIYEADIGMLNEKKKKIDKRKILAFDIMLIALALIIVLKTQNIGLLMGVIYFAVVGSFQIFSFIYAVHDIRKKDENNLCVAKFHSAEHMVINAYKSLQRIPTLDEIKKFSRFSKDCGSYKILYFLSRTLFITLMMVIVLNWNAIIYLLLIICGAVFIEVANQKGWLKGLQILVTAKPTDLELTLAIEGLKQFEKMEELFESEDHCEISIKVL